MNTKFNLELAQGNVFKAIITGDIFINEFVETTHWCRYANDSLAFSIEATSKRFYKTIQMAKGEQIKHVNSDEYEITEETGFLIPIRYATLIMPTRDECLDAGYLYNDLLVSKDELDNLRKFKSLIVGRDDYRDPFIEGEVSPHKLDLARLF